MKNMNPDQVDSGTETGTIKVVTHPGAQHISSDDFYSLL